MRIASLWLMLALYAFPADIPKNFADNVRFARAGEASGKLSEHRFLQAVYYAATQTQQKPPRILVIHCDDYFAEFVGMQKKIGVALFTPNDPSGLYEMWIYGEGTDTKFAIGTAGLFVKTREEMEPLAKHVLTALSATVEVKK